MSFGISYSKNEFYAKWFQSCRSTPFEDWQARGSMLDAVFQYTTSCEDEVTRFYFMPGNKFGYIEMDAEFVVSSFKVWFEISFDEDSKIVHLERLFYTREYPWCDETPEGSGGIAFYNKAVREIGNDISLDTFVEQFFGPKWRVAPLPITRPKIREDYLQLGQNTFATTEFKARDQQSQYA